MRKIALIVIAALMVLSIPATAETPTDEQSRITAIEKTIASTVKLYGYSQLSTPDQTGTGFFIAPNRILTAAHVVIFAGVTRIEVEMSDGRKCAGKIGYRDSGVDLSIVETDCTATPLTLTDNSPVGSDVYMIGHPKSLDWIVTEGIVSRVYREPAQQTIIADIDGEHGNSGSPMINNSGEIIALAEAQNNQDHYLIFGIKSETIKAFLRRAGL